MKENIKMQAMEQCVICETQTVAHACTVKPSAALALDVQHFNLYRCSKCGFMLAFPLPDQKMLEQVYGDSFHLTAQQTLPQDENGNLAPQAKKTAIYRNAQKRVQRLTRWKNGGDLLDVGCGKGIFVMTAGQHFNAAGIDFSPSAVEWGKKMGLKLQAGDFLKTAWGNRRFDVITMWDVLACLPDPTIVLKKVGELLKDDGIFVFTLPMSDSLAARLMGTRWPFMIPPINVSYYTRRSVSRLVERSGFELLSDTRPGKWVDISFAWLKLKRMLGMPGKGTAHRGNRRPKNIPLNFYDLATIVIKKVKTKG